MVTNRESIRSYIASTRGIVIDLDAAAMTPSIQISLPLKSAQKLVSCAVTFHPQGE